MRFLLFVLGGICAAGTAAATSVELSEVVSDPQTDWSGDGRLTSADEFIELFNAGSVEVDLAGWHLEVLDSTPESHQLANILGPQERMTVWNPKGAINNDAAIELCDPTGALIDSVRLGVDAPTGDAQSPADESMARTGRNWTKAHATPGDENTRPFLLVTGDAIEGWVRPQNETIVRVDARYTFGNLSRLEWQAGPAGGSVNLSATAAAQWSAEFSWAAPEQSSQLHFVAHQDGGSKFEIAGPLLRVDGDAPSGARLDAPGWVAARAFPYRVLPATDNASGGVQYSLVTENSSTPWSTVPPAGALELGPHKEKTLILRIRDAVGNEATLAHVVRLDDQPPGPIAPYARQESGILALQWSRVTDVGSGVKEIRLNRTVGAKVQSLTLPADTTYWSDPWTDRLTTANYSLVAVDEAGNLGRPFSFTPVLELHRPHLLATRSSSLVWGDEGVRVHLDFDRRMDAERVPEVILESSPMKFSLGGHWMANATTFRVDVEDPTRFPSGPATIRVLSAHSAQGQPLWEPAELELTVDREPPLLSSNDVDGWVGPAGLELRAQDPEGAARIRWRTSSGWELAGPTLLIPVQGTLSVEAVAEDGAGRRSAAWKNLARVDATAPTLRNVSHDADAIIVRAFDDESGLASLSVAGKPAPGEGGVKIPWLGRSFINVEAVDRVGNRASWNLTPPAVQESTPSAFAGPATLDVGRPSHVAAPAVTPIWRAVLASLALPILCVPAARWWLAKRRALTLKTSG